MLAVIVFNFVRPKTKYSHCKKFSLKLIFFKKNTLIILNLAEGSFARVISALDREIILKKEEEKKRQKRPALERVSSEDGYFCSAQLCVREPRARGVSCRGETQTKIAVYFSCKRLTRFMSLLCVADVFVFIRLCLFSRAGQITWLHMLTDPNTCFSH